MEYFCLFIITVVVVVVVVVVTYIYFLQYERTLHAWTCRYTLLC